jgi:glycosidase
MRVALALLLACACANAARATKVTFRYQPAIGGVASVAVAGSFNGWNATANPMTDADKDGVWETSLDLSPGRVEYKFVVNGDQWITDEGAAEFSPDGFGGQNSVLVVKDTPVTAGTGATAKKAIAEAQLRKVIFTYTPAVKPQSVSLAGSFNDWTIGKTPMTDPDGDGTYTATLLLASGEYPYKFVVNGGQWTQDKAGQDKEVDDGFGGKNSVRVVDERFPAVVAKKGDGVIATDGITHEQNANEVNNLGDGRVELTARAHRGDVERVYANVTSSAASAAPVTHVSMQVANSDRAYDYFHATVDLRDGGTYVFEYHDGATDLYLTPKGFTSRPDSGGSFAFAASRFPAFTTPDWVKNAVIYQIFPDRFRNGNTANDPDFHEWYYQGKTALPPSGKINPDYQEYFHLVKNWADADALTKSPYTPDGRDWMAFFGGDIAGVREKLGYLKDLGITAIYFNPLFEAKSTHKYDCADYKKIDPHFGSNEEFIDFVKAAHAAGIHVILDIVYNHSGNTHWAFKDAVEKGPKSEYYTWYEFKKWPLPDGWPNVQHAWKPADYYYCWWGFGDLPDMNFDLSRNNDAEKAIKDVSQAQVNEPLVTYLLDTTEYWLKDADVDGVRLDVPNELPYWFWMLFNKRVKSVKPDAYIVGELWGNATDYVKPGVYDAVMNYAFFRDPVTKFLGMGQGTAEEFDASLASGRLAYPSQAVEVQMNLIDSHDTVRFLTQVGGNVNRLKLAALFGMTYIGAPTIYYGDEIGMQGGKDPDCRRPFIWTWEGDPQRMALHDYYKKLIAARKAHAALRTGEFRTLYATGMQYAYARSGGGENFVVALNAGKQSAKLPIDLAAFGGKVTAVDLLSGESVSWSGAAQVSLPPETGRVFRLTRAVGGASRSSTR